MKSASAAIVAAAIALFSTAEAQPPPPAQPSASPTARLAVARPDLTFRRTFLRAYPGGQVIDRVRRGNRYYACFVVANIGAAASGPFRVAGGGLGVPFNPFQDHAGLAPGATRLGCLLYPTTPPPGVYNLGLKADSLNAVVEANEANNTATIGVTVVP
jgi:hypothetical protein